jgi:hypothetical protein
MQKHIIHSMAPNAFEALLKAHALDAMLELDFTKPISADDRRKVSRSPALGFLFLAATR